MKAKLIIGMLLLSLIVLSGCGWDPECLTEIAEKFCEEKDCVVRNVYSGSKALWDIKPYFKVFVGEWREEKRLEFTATEEKFCEKYTRLNKNVRKY